MKLLISLARVEIADTAQVFTNIYTSRSGHFTLCQQSSQLPTPCLGAVQLLFVSSEKIKRAVQIICPPLSSR